MRILLDLTQIPLERTGVGVYAEHLVWEMTKLLGENDHLVLLVQDDDAKLVHWAREQKRVSLLRVPARIFRNRLALLLLEQVWLPCLVLRHKIQLLHSLHYTFPLLAPCARAVTVHDLTFSLFPELHTRGRRLLFPFFTRQVLRRAECPLYVSASTRADAERLFGPSRYSGHVTHLGIDKPALMSMEQARAILTSSGVSAPFLLFVGTLEPRKNIARLIEAFASVSVRHPGWTLVLAGKFGWHTAEIARSLREHSTRAPIRHLGYVSDREKQALLRSCAALVYPSLYEGFGLPVLEAMVCGAPVITSDRSSMKEIAQGAALLVDPTCVASIAEAMEVIVRQEGTVRDLRAAGAQRAAQFPWAGTVRSTWNAYQQALAQRLERSNRGSGRF